MLLWLSKWGRRWNGGGLESTALARSTRTDETDEGSLQAVPSMHQSLLLNPLRALAGLLENGEKEGVLFDGTSFFLLGHYARASD